MNAPAATLKPPYVAGDVVRHTGAFLRAVCWFTAPINGEVIAVGELAGSQLLTVRWSDGTEGSINEVNVEFCPRGRRLTRARDREQRQR